MYNIQRIRTTKQSVCMLLPYFDCHVEERHQAVQFLLIFSWHRPLIFFHDTKMVCP